jgi:glycosyltransferase involved in cell wall biosynthesis
MRVLFVSAVAFLPQLAGGTQSSTDQLARQLLTRGQEPAVFAALIGGGWIELVSRIKLKFGGRGLAHDKALGYSVFRSWNPKEQLRAAVERFRPDVAVVQSLQSVAFGHLLEELAVPVVVYLRNVEFRELGGAPDTLRRAHFVANSEFTARTYKAAFNIDSTVIPPLIEQEKYRTATTRETVLFINPHPHKGYDIAVEVARRCRDIPFLFVESWALDDQQRARVRAEAGSLPNVTLRPRTHDMKSVFARTRFVLAPSRWEEAWGRIASEAHVSGIPVVASKKGGLPEAVGPGGILLDYEAPIEQWADVVSRLWSDAALYRDKCDAALQYSMRPALQERHQTETFLGVLAAAAATAAASAGKPGTGPAARSGLAAS